MRIQDHFSISVNLDVGCGHRRVSVCSAQVCAPLGHSSLYFCIVFRLTDFVSGGSISLLDTVFDYFCCFMC